MDISQIIQSLIGFVGGVITTIIAIWYQNRLNPPRVRTPPAGSGPLSKVVLTTLTLGLSDRARKKIEQSHFIPVGETRIALMELVGSAKSSDSILAICGNKGDYSGAYYQQNFDKCRAVTRIFSYESIRNEIEHKGVRYALNGLRIHMEMLNKKKPKVEVILLPKAKFIKDIGAGTFDPPPSFGLAILRDGDDLPKRAVIHWETDAKALRHLISIEGIIIDPRQDELLNELVNLHKRIAGSDVVLTSKKDIGAILETITELENLWTANEGAKT